jgi:hypothetical protein
MVVSKRHLLKALLVLVLATKAATQCYDIKSAASFRKSTSDDITAEAVQGLTFDAEEAKAAYFLDPCQLQNATYGERKKLSF